MLSRLLCHVITGSDRISYGHCAHFISSVFTMMLCDAVKSSPVYCLHLAFSAGAVVREITSVKQKA